MQTLRFANEVVADNVACYESRPAPRLWTKVCQGNDFFSQLFGANIISFKFNLGVFAVGDDFC